jgi:transcriptional regulator with XRE-family HTH domain
MKTKKKKPGKMDIALRLTRFRNEAPGILGITFEEILERCGIPENDYRANEQGRKMLRTNHLKSLQKEFKLNIIWLLGLDVPMFQEKIGFNRQFRDFRETGPGILGVTFEEILQRCGITEKDYRAYEEGLKNPHPYHLFILSKEFNLNINWFYGKEDSTFTDSGCLGDVPVNLSDHSSRSFLFKEAMENPDVEYFFLSLTDFLLGRSEGERKNLFQSWAGLHQNFNRISGKLSRIFYPQPGQAEVTSKKAKPKG